MFKLSQLREMIANARRSGLPTKQFGDLRTLMISSGSHPTKKRLSRAERTSKRRSQKKSRQTNHHRQHIRNITKGHKKSGRV